MCFSACKKAKAYTLPQLTLQAGAAKQQLAAEELKQQRMLVHIHILPTETPIMPFETEETSVV